MRHLKKYNENKSFEFDERYIKECFIEFFDNAEKYDVYEEVDTTNEYIEYGLGIDCPDLEIEINHNVDDFIKISEELVDFYKEIGVCIEKVKIKYTDVDVILYQNNRARDQGILSGTRFIWVKIRKNI
jgi:hypothetical protein